MNAATLGRCLVLWSVIVVPIACAPRLHWVHDSPAAPSCEPDRLLTWEDFKERSGHGRRGAETAVRFHLDGIEPGRIRARLDHGLSWVKPEVVHAADHKRALRLLRHEQVHFAISCLLTREANAALATGGDPQAMLLLLNAVATRLNVQYDVESNHGLNEKGQARWEEAVQRRLSAGPLTQGGRQVPLQTEVSVPGSP